MLRSVSGSNSSRGIAAVVGVGPRLGSAVARKFASEGYTVAILSRDLEKLSQLAEEIAKEAKAQVFALRVDCADARSVREAFEGVLSLGPVEVLVYNAGEPPADDGDGDAIAPPRPNPFLAISPDSFHRSLAVSAAGAFYCAQQVIPGMVERGRGTVIFTGSSASVTGFAGYSDLSCGKFALRGLSQSLAKEFQPAGVHIAHMIIDGAIGEPRSSARGRCGGGEADPDAVAQSYWHVHAQDKSAWTHEMDIRSPSSTMY
uniref:3-oxoacyl-[acyl-carrier-protein] reductase n=1 Tax=Leersia perrieri TaxID=77586 RepID=A0A0D9X8W1_9ORYZ